MSRTRSRVVLAAAALACMAAAAGAWVHILIPGQKAFGTISEADQEDRITFHAETGWTVSFTVKARKGEVPALAPVFSRLEDPDGIDVLDDANPVTNARGTATKIVKFAIPTTGDWVLGITGASSTTGTWDLISRGPAKIPLGTGTIAGADEQVEHEFDADIGTVAAIQAKAALGSLLHPLMVRVTSPGASDLDLAAAGRRTTKKSDKVAALALDENGTYTLVVTGAESSTGDYAATLKPSRKVPLDFTTDPDGGPPPSPAPTVSSVSPASVAVPVSGTEARSIDVTGTHFVSGCTASITAPSGTNGITNVQTTFNSASSLTVDFDLDSSATLGARDVTVTNPDLQAGSKASAFTLSSSTLSITSVTPAAGPGAGGTQVIVQGTQFTSGTTVTFGGVAARTVNVVDATSILCTVPPAATLSPTAGSVVEVGVDDGAGGTATLLNAFTYDADPVRPMVSSVVPAGGATGIARNIRKVVFVFTEPMASGPVVTTNFDFFRSASSGPNPGTNDVSSPRVTAVAGADGRRMVVITRNATPGSLTSTATYVAQIHSNLQTTNLMTDTAGNVLDPTPFAGPVFQSTFTTGAGNDAAMPSVSATVPVNAATGVAVDVQPVVTFSEAVDPSTLVAAVTLKLGGTTTVPIDLAVDDTCTSVTILPRSKLTANSSYAIGVAGTVTDLVGLTLASAFSATFSTAASDGISPVQALTVDALPQDQNGSGTYASGQSNGGTPSGSGAATAFDAYLPRSGFTIDVSFADTGGSGVDPSTFSCTCTSAMGSVGAGQELASLFTVNPLGATWTVDSSHALAAASNVSFSVNVADYAGNAAATQSLVVDVADITKTINDNAGTPGTDRDPFNSRQSWLLRFDQDIWTITESAGGSGSHTKPLTITTSLASDGIKDFRQDLGLVGLNGTEVGAAATVTNGADTGTNAIVQTMVKNAVRGYLNTRYGIAYDGTHGADGANIEFLLQGETKSGGGTVTNVGWTSGSGFSMMTFTGDERANANGGVVGRANYDRRNTQQDDDSNTGDNTGANVGTFATHMIRVRINDPDSTSFPATFDPLISLNSRGGTPVGSDANDSTVLGGGFVYASGTAAQKARYDVIMKAVSRYGLYLSGVGAHEIGHSTGLVADGGPPTGIFGNAHPSSPFVVSPGTYTTSTHLDVAGPNIMEAASSFDEAIGTGSDFMTFEPLSLSYLLRRAIYDQ